MRHEIPDVADQAARPAIVAEAEQHFGVQLGVDDQRQHQHADGGERHLRRGQVPQAAITQPQPAAHDQADESDRRRVIDVMPRLAVGEHGRVIERDVAGPSDDLQEPELAARIGQQMSDRRHGTVFRGTESGHPKSFRRRAGSVRRVSMSLRRRSGPASHRDKNRRAILRRTRPSPRKESMQRHGRGLA